MENNAAKQTHKSMTPADRIRHWFGGDREAIRIIAVSVQNWPELVRLNDGEIALGADDLIRLALWSASKCCAALLSTRRATLLLQGSAETREIRCLVIANTSLATSRPLSGFLLKPVELRDAPCNAGDIGQAPRANETEPRAGEIRHALFDAFPPPITAGEPPPPGRMLRSRQ